MMCESALRDDRLVYAPMSAVAWSRAGSSWSSTVLHETLRERVVFTLIQDRNLCGLRTETLLDQHVELGQVGGSIVLVANEDGCDRWIHAN